MEEFEINLSENKVAKVIGKKQRHKKKSLSQFLLFQ